MSLIRLNGAIVSYAHAFVVVQWFRQILSPSPKKMHIALQALGINAITHVVVCLRENAVKYHHLN